MNALYGHGSAPTKWFSIPWFRRTKWLRASQWLARYQWSPLSMATTKDTHRHRPTQARGMAGWVVGVTLRRHIGTNSQFGGSLGVSARCLAFRLSVLYVDWAVYYDGASSKLQRGNRISWTLKHNGKLCLRVRHSQLEGWLNLWRFSYSKWSAIAILPGVRHMASRSLMRVDNQLHIIALGSPSFYIRLSLWADSLSLACYPLLHHSRRIWTSLVSGYIAPATGFNRCLFLANFRGAPALG